MSPKGPETVTVETASEGIVSVARALQINDEKHCPQCGWSPSRPDTKAVASERP